MIRHFNFAATPPLFFGKGKLSVLPSAIKSFGSKILLVTGARSFLNSAPGEQMIQDLNESKIAIEHYRIDREPTPSLIDAAVDQFSSYAPDCVVAIGGGSALDGGKAISAMLPMRASVKDYLEGVGTKSHPGTKVPFIAIPTTSGTGSEATRNAVISETGENGFKRSLRHNNFVPNVAIVDPLLTLGCSPETTAASGMDAFTQLAESYLSTESNPLTDALAYEGLKHIASSLKRSFEDGNNVEARTGMALASYLSGVTLANAGLGLVHGLASPIGGYFEIPHGIICSALMSPANKVTVRKLRLKNANPGALKKYSNMGRLFSSEEGHPDAYYTDLFLSVIERWTKEMNIPQLSIFGMQRKDLGRIVRATDNKNNPISLDEDEMMEILKACVQ
jgi:alcohol dehydrogenase class IV